MINVVAECSRAGKRCECYVGALKVRATISVPDTDCHKHSIMTEVDTSAGNCSL